VREAVLVHRALGTRRRGRARKVQQLDADAVARQVLGVELRAAEAKERVRGLAFHVELVLPGEAEEVAVEAERALEIRDADADVGDARDREHAIP
jgi:hypothetical protein